MYSFFMQPWQMFILNPIFDNFFIEIVTGPLWNFTEWPSIIIINPSFTEKKNKKICQIIFSRMQFLEYLFDFWISQKRVRGCIIWNLRFDHNMSFWTSCPNFRKINQIFLCMVIWWNSLCIYYLFLIFNKS